MCHTCGKTGKNKAGCTSCSVHTYPMVYPAPAYRAHVGSTGPLDSGGMPLVEGAEPTSYLMYPHDYKHSPIPVAGAGPRASGANFVATVPGPTRPAAPHVPTTTGPPAPAGIFDTSASTWFLLVGAMGIGVVGYWVYSSYKNTGTLISSTKQAYVDNPEAFRKLGHAATSAGTFAVKSLTAVGTGGESIVADQALNVAGAGARRVLNL